MANRIVYYVDKNNNYKNKNIEFHWFPGFAVSQKQKSIMNLHQNFWLSDPEYKIIEISSASENPIGIAASAFNLKVKSRRSIYTVEQLFQSSKVFEKSGKQIQLLTMSSADARNFNKKRNRDDKLIYFDLFDKTFPLEPKNYFYNWLYINSLMNSQTLAKDIIKFDAFTDINANPSYTINTQAEACSIFVSLYRKKQLKQALKNRKAFLQIVYGIVNG